MTPGTYKIISGSLPASVPVTGHYAMLKVEVLGGNAYYLQTFTVIQNTVYPIIYQRRKGSGWTDWIKISQANIDAGWNLGVYINTGGTNGFAVFVPYDVSNKGVPTITRIDVQYVGEYSTNPSVINSRANGFYATSDNLPQSANYVGNICSVYISAQS